MWIELVEPFGATPAGSIIEVKDATGQGLIRANQAVESNELAHIRRCYDEQLNQLRSEQQAVLQQITRSSAGHAPVPGQGPTYTDQGVPSSHVTPGLAEHERGTQCFTDILRQIFNYQARGGFDEDYRKMVSRKRLTTVYKFPEVERAVDSQGRIVAIERSENGETIMRTGTESVGGGPTYGFLVKPEWYGVLYRVMMERSVLAEDGFQVPIGQSLELKWPALDQFAAPVAGQSSIYAGVSVNRAGEVQQRIYSDGKVYEIDFKVTDLTGFSTLSRDLIADNYIAADAMLQELFGMAFAWKFDWETLFGPGPGSPLGIYNSKAIVTVTRKATSLIKYEDLVAMQSQLYPSCWPTAFWLTNNATFAQIANVISNTTNTFAYIPNALVTQAQMPVAHDKYQQDGKTFQARGLLLGMPVRFSEKVPQLGTTGDIILIDPKSYGIAQRAGLEVGLSEHFLFDTDRIAYRFKMRNDARPLWRSYYQQPDNPSGTGTSMSPFVALHS